MKKSRLIKIHLLKEKGISYIFHTMWYLLIHHATETTISLWFDLSAAHYHNNKTISFVDWQQEWYGRQANISADISVGKLPLFGILYCGPFEIFNIVCFLWKTRFLIMRPGHKFSMKRFRSNRVFDDIVCHSSLHLCCLILSLGIFVIIDALNNSVRIPCQIFCKRLPQINVLQ